MSVFRNKDDKRYWEIKGIVKSKGKVVRYSKRSIKDPRFKSKKYALQLDYDLKNAAYKKLEGTFIETPTLNYVCEEFIKSKSNDVSPRYLDFLKKTVIENYIFKFFDKNNIVTKEFTETKCINFRNFISKNPYSTSFKNKILARMIDIIVFTRTLKIINSDTKDDLIYTLSPLKQSSSEIRNQSTKNKYTSLVDAKKVWQNAKPPFDFIFEFFYFSGCRIGEFLGLKVEDFHFEDNSSYFEIKRQEEREKGVTTDNLKTASSYRKVIILNSLKNKILNYIKAYNISKNDFLIPFSRTEFRRQLDKAFIRANVEHNTLHGFGRKSISTEIYKLTNDAKISQKYLGHKEVDMTLNTYVDNDEGDEKLIRILDEMDKQK